MSTFFGAQFLSLHVFICLQPQSTEFPSVFDLLPAEFANFGGEQQPVGEFARGNRQDEFLNGVGRFVQRNHAFAGPNRRFGRPQTTRLEEEPSARNPSW